MGLVLGVGINPAQTAGATPGTRQPNPYSQDLLAKWAGWQEKEKQVLQDESIERRRLNLFNLKHPGHQRSFPSNLFHLGGLRLNAAEMEKCFFWPGQPEPEKDITGNFKC